MRQILVPKEVAEKCTLPEAIKWIAFNSYPIACYTGNGVERREDIECCESTWEDEINEAFFFTDEICDKYGLPSTGLEMYYNEYDELPEYAPSVTFIEGIKQSGKSKAEYIEKLIEQQHAAEEYNKKQKIFADALEEFLEIPKAELLLFLRKGLIESYGRPHSEEFEDYQEHEPIAHKLWKASNLEWDTSTLNTDNLPYIHILIDVESLFLAFPEPEAETIKVLSINGTLVTNNAPFLKPSPPKGRPSYNWKQFTEEMITRMQKGLPSLQKICVSDMKEWCVNNWGEVPSETNLKEHISPFYNALKKSESRN